MLVKEKYNAVQIGDCTLYQGDCMEIMPLLPRFDAVVTDPPYGIGEAAGKNKSRRKLAQATDYGNANWDNKTAPDAIACAVTKSTYSIVFGGNYYDLPPTSCWLIWDKLNGASDFADCELAWTNLKSAVRRLSFQWNGMIRREKHIPRQHPTQKPVEVMKWCIGFLPQAQTIFDPFMGSGTTGVACAKMGLKFTGIELDPKYFDIACKRIEDAYAEPDLFVEQPEEKLKQTDLFKEAK
jgi:site-specific DNA-methyltransferase (adenine-specific)/modification methylase